MRTSDDDCAAGDAREYLFSKETAKGTRYGATLCFKPRDFPTGKLIPYRIDADGTLWGNEPYSTDVSEYTSAYGESFVVSPADERWIDSRRWPLRREQIRDAAPWVVGGVFVIWLISAIIGWIVRGFLGIPAGQDQRR